MAYLTTATHRLHFKTVGCQQTADQLTQPPLLILHGFLGSCEDFAGVLPLLSRHFYCILPDLPGHGQTTLKAAAISETTALHTGASQDGYSFLETGRSLIALLNHLQIDRTNLLGYSMGGRIALYMACSYPERIARTFLESASPGLKTAAERQARLQKDEALARQLERLPLPAFLSMWYANPLFASLQRYPDVRAAMVNRRKRNNPIELARALRGLGTGRQKSMWPNLSRLNAPLMLMVGENDEKFVGLGQAIAKECERNNKSKVVLKRFEGCGHNIHLEIAQESPENYVDAVLSLLSAY
ncbi:MAG: 2-succinyl-6-hydroxy-2,4-cyclohexadiene-1-carboxylate synthase [Phormidesmis sp.]